MQNQTRTIYIERAKLFPPVSRTDADYDDDDEAQGDNAPRAHAAAAGAPRVAAFAIGITVQITQLARCVVISLVDVSADDRRAHQRAGSELQQQQQQGPVTTSGAPLADDTAVVNACAIPALGATVATVPRGLGVAVASSTLVEPASGAGGAAGGQSGDASTGGASSLQECIARTVAERLIARCNRTAAKAPAEGAAMPAVGTGTLLLCDKLVVAQCGVGLGAGINAREGADFLAQALGSPILAAEITMACASMLQV